MAKLPSFEIIAGSYEEFLLGYYFSKENEVVQSFAAHDHSASVRCVTASGHYVASGGSDDRICVYDMKTRKEHCSLTHHNATITCLQFTENHSHLISGSSDGVLAITRVGNWQLEKLWDKAHKGASVLDVAVHSSGKLALSLGSDCSLCTWNLVKGRLAYIINLNTKSIDPRSLEKIIWAPDGVRFVLYGGKFTEIWSLESGGIVDNIEHTLKVTSCIWFGEGSLIVGYESGEICKINISTKKKKSYSAHTNRVKCLVRYEKKIISSSSNGEIKVWDKHFQEIAKHDTGCRITCLCIVPIMKVKNEDETPSATEVVQPVAKKISQAYIVETVEDSDGNLADNIKTSKQKKKKNKKRPASEDNSMTGKKKTKKSVVS